MIQIWEPFVESLVKAIEAIGASSASTKSAKIQEIWSIDCVNSGDAGALNEPCLGSAFTWLDHPRDLLQFADYYLPRRHLSSSKAEGVKELGPLWPPDTLRKTRKGEGRQGRRIIGVGHSFSEYESGTFLLLMRKRDPHSVATCQRRCRDEDSQ